MNFINSEFDAFERDFKLATQKLCDKYQLKLGKMKISYSSIDFDMKVTFEKNEEGLSVERIRFETDCGYYGFDPEDYMRLFRVRGVEYEFIGFARSAKKYNCIVRELETGNQIRFNDRYLHCVFDQQMMQGVEL